MARKRPLRSDSRFGWQILPPQPGPASAAGTAGPSEVTEVPAGAIELWPQGDPAGGPSANRCRLVLLREASQWRLVAAELGPGAGGSPVPAPWSMAAECLGEFRAEVEERWGEAVWLALLRASAIAVQALAPAVMAPRLELLLAE
jgi:hypothetical protein